MNMGTNWSESEEDSKESDVSLKSDGSQCYKIWSSLRPEDLIGADIDSVADDEDWVKSSYSLMAKGSMESIDSGVSFKSDWSKHGLTDFKDRVSLSMPDLSSYLMYNPVSYTEWVKSSHSGMAKRSMESIVSGVSLKSDWSQRGLLHFKDRVSLSRSDLSSYLMDNPVAHLKDWIESSDDLMAKGSMESIDSDVSFKRDQSKLRLIEFNKDSLLREEMNQELSSEVRLEHR